MRQRKGLLAACAVAAVAAIVGVGMHMSKEAPSSSVAVLQPASKSVVAQSPVTPLSSAATGNSHPRSTPSTSSSKSTEFNQLVNSGQPADKLKAYMLAQMCVWATEAQRSAEMTPAAERSPEVRKQLDSGEFKAKAAAECGDLSDQQILGRRKYVQEAAEAGVPTAALRLAEEGPFGDLSALVNRPDDPAVLEWRRHTVDLLKLAAKKGDVDAMGSLSNMYATGGGIIEGRDPVKALEYNTAMWEAVKKATGKESAFAGQKIRELSEGLTAEQIEAAKKAGHMIAMGEDK